MTIREIQETNQSAYTRDFHALNYLRKKHILNHMKMPDLRINFFINGESGSGKNLMSKAIARILFPNIKNEDEIFFTLGKNNVSFDCYDGQPVIIWNDVRAFELYKELKSQDAIYDVFNTHPTNNVIGIKYGKIRLCNKVNIINNLQSYNEFFHNLVCGEDIIQAYRRFPFIIEMNKRGTNMFNLYINKGFLSNEIEGKNYYAKKNIFFDLKKDGMLHNYDLTACRNYENVALGIIKMGYDLTVSNHSLNLNTNNTVTFTNQFSLQLL